MQPDLLDNVTIALVDTKTPANIGSVARSMMNMGLSRLRLVNPPDDPDGMAKKLAAGADRILEEAEIYFSFAHAVADQGLVIGISRHAGRLRKNVQTPREMAAQVVRLLERNSVSLVFGNEVNGLERAELAQCHQFVAIPSSDAFPSLNLSHAVAILAYELYVAYGELGAVPSAVQLAPKKELEGLYTHLESILADIGFLDPDRPERMMFALRQIFGRAALDSRDVSILRGILRNIERSLRHAEKTDP